MASAGRRNWRYATAGFIFELCAVPNRTASGTDRRHRGCQSAGRRRVSRSEGYGQGALSFQRREFEREPRARGATIFQRDGRRMQFGNALDDRKPKTRASRLSAIAPPEAPKDKVA